MKARAVPCWGGKGKNSLPDAGRVYASELCLGRETEEKKGAKMKY